MSRSFEENFKAIKAIGRRTSLEYSGNLEECGTGFCWLTHSGDGPMFTWRLSCISTSGAYGGVKWLYLTRDTRNRRAPLEVVILNNYFKDPLKATEAECTLFEIETGHEYKLKGSIDK